jgi:hypothetical protein
MSKSHGGKESFLPFENVRICAKHPDPQRNARTKNESTQETQVSSASFAAFFDCSAKKKIFFFKQYFRCIIIIEVYIALFRFRCTNGGVQYDQNA